MKQPLWLKTWLNRIIEQSSFFVETINIQKSKEWIYKNGKIQHRSGKFFSIVGVEWITPNNQKIKQPLIDQQEIGILGFLIHKESKQNTVLAQAKIEPGNVNGVQLAPSCQATANNIARVHGGDPPPFVSLFTTDNNLIHQSLQSEHGTRFFKKRNRNILKKSEKIKSLPITHRWVKIEEFLELLSCDFLVNTDARSVLVSSPWDQLVNRPIFSRYKTTFAKELLTSANTKTDDARYICQKLTRYRKKVKPPKIIPLNTLYRPPFKIRHIKVKIYGREVPRWDQPIIDTPKAETVDLICGRKNGILYFLFKLQIEPGLYNYVELGPCLMSDVNKNTKTKGKILLECRQSEEGGRFFRDISHYRIIDAGDTYEASDDYQWLTLNEVQLLLKDDGVFTNEARSVLSLLLTWL